MILAHQVEAMARRKVLKPVAHYLRADDPKSTGGSRAVLDRMRRFAARNSKPEGGDDGVQ